MSLLHYIATTPEENAQHGLAAHGFFIPDVEYLVDLEGLLSYIGDKVGVGHCCVYCHKVFASIRSCQDHMVRMSCCASLRVSDTSSQASVSHCKMIYDEEDGEWDDFYDFSEQPLSDLQSAFVGVLCVLRLCNKASYSRAFYISVTPDGHQMLIGDTGKALGHRDFRVYYAQRVPPSSMQVATVSGAARERAAHLRAIYTKMIGDGRMRQLAPETAAARAARKHHHSEQRKKDLRTAQTNELMMGKHFRRRDIHW